MFLRRNLNYFRSLPLLILNVTNLAAVVFQLIFYHRTRPVLLKLRDGTQIKLYTFMDLWTFKEVYLDRDYEKHSLPLQNGWIIFDIGAAFGDFSTLAAKKCPHSRVYAFEPYPRYYHLISQNLALNKILNVNTFSSAVGSSPLPKILDLSSGEAVMFTTSRSSGAQLPHQLSVPVVTLEEIFNHHKISHCDYLKMDCEAGEYEILFNSSPQTLRRIHHICMEYHDNITAYTGVDMAAFLESRGFAVKTYPNKYRKDIGYIYAQNTRFKSSP